MKGVYQQVRLVWKKPRENLGKAFSDRLVSWRREPATLRIERPTRIDRARQAGYKAKQGVFIVRQRVSRGTHTRPKFAGGRKPKKMRRTLVLEKNYQRIAEERAAKKFNNCEVLNSYFLAKDGKNYWYEIILVDRSHPVVTSDKNLSWINRLENRGRVFRGLTLAGKRSRGLRWKGIGSEKR